MQKHWFSRKSCVPWFTECAWSNALSFGCRPPLQHAAYISFISGTFFILSRGFFGQPFFLFFLFLFCFFRSPCHSIIFFLFFSFQSFTRISVSLFYLLSLFPSLSSTLTVFVSSESSHQSAAFDQDLFVMQVQEWKSLPMAWRGVRVHPVSGVSEPNHLLQVSGRVGCRKLYLSRTKRHRRTLAHH
jgi:hypothetical protein